MWPKTWVAVYNMPAWPVKPFLLVDIDLFEQQLWRGKTNSIMIAPTTIWDHLTLSLELCRITPWGRWLNRRITSHHELVNDDKLCRVSYNDQIGTQWVLQNKEYQELWTTFPQSIVCSPKSIVRSPMSKVHSLKSIVQNLKSIVQSPLSKVRINRE